MSASSKPDRIASAACSNVSGSMILASRSASSWASCSWAAVNASGAISKLTNENVSSSSSRTDAIARSASCVENPNWDVSSAAAWAWSSTASRRVAACSAAESPAARASTIAASVSSICLEIASSVSAAVAWSPPARPCAVMNASASLRSASTAAAAARSAAAIFSSAAFWAASAVRACASASLSSISIFASNAVFSCSAAFFASSAVSVPSACSWAICSSEFW